MISSRATTVSWHRFVPFAGKQKSYSRRIFINYRREDTAGHVHSLFEALTKRFGAARVFRDIDGIDAGTDFVAALHRELESCLVMLVVIGHEWLTVQDPKLKTRRLDDSTDFVRLEVATALRNDKVRVIPVLVAGATMPAAADLPDDLKPLARRHYVELTDTRWRADTAQLLKVLEKACGDAPLWVTRAAKALAPPAAVILAVMLAWLKSTDTTTPVTPPPAAVFADPPVVGPTGTGGREPDDTRGGVPDESKRPSKAERAEQPDRSGGPQDAGRRAGVVRTVPGGGTDGRDTQAKPPDPIPHAPSEPAKQDKARPTPTEHDKIREGEEQNTRDQNKRDAEQQADAQKAAEQRAATQRIDDIKALIERFRQAYVSRDQDALQKIYPGVQADAVLAVNRKNCEAVALEFGEPDIKLISTSEAFVTVQATYGCDPKTGQKMQMAPPKTDRYQVAVRDGVWVIEARLAEIDRRSARR